MYLASQLTEISSRFPAHVGELREFLVKEKLPVGSAEAIPELANRLGADARFRADVGSLLRATLYRERERVGYDELLGMLVAAAAGTKEDLKSESQAAEIREMLRFVAQSRRMTFRVDGDEESDSAEETMEPVAAGARAVKAEALGPEPVLAARLHSRLDAAAKPMQAEPRKADRGTAVAQAESPEPGDLVLPPFRTSGLFAAQTEVEAPWWRAHPAWSAGVVCMVVGLGLGLSLHRVVSAAERHVALHVLSSSSSSKPVNPKPVVPVQNAAGDVIASAATQQSVHSEQNGRGAAAGIMESPVGTDQIASVAEGGRAAVQSAPLEGRATPPPAMTGKSSAVPVTVVKQVVTASADSDDAGATQMAAATRSLVHPGSAGMTAASVIFSPAPEYPAAAAAAGVHGQVTVHAVVDPDGNVIYARAVSGPALLRDAAQEAVQKWRYSPLLNNGKPIAVTTVAILDFKVAK